jgi:hypothetical protein
MVPVKMADENPIDASRSHIGKDELPLSSLAWIEEEPLLIPTDEISAVIPFPRRLLTGAA